MNNEGTNWLGGSWGMVPRENFEFVVFKNAISRILTKAFLGFLMFTLIVGNYALTHQ